MKESIPKLSQYCGVCLLKEGCEKSKTCACEEFKTNVKLHTKK